MMVDSRDISWDEHPSSPDRSQGRSALPSKAMAFLKQLKPLGPKQQAARAYRCAKGLLSGLQRAPKNIIKNWRNPRELKRGRAGTMQSDKQMETFAGEMDYALPPNEVTHLKWKEGKLSDSRWWYPFSQNRKQKYAEIQKIIGDGKLRPPVSLEDFDDDEESLDFAFATPCPEVL